MKAKFNIAGGEIMIQEDFFKFELNHNVVKKEIDKKLDECIQKEMWWVSAERIAQLTDMSLRYAEEHILSDIRMKAIERRRSRKRFYPAKEAYEVVNEILNSW